MRRGAGDGGGQVVEVRLLVELDGGGDLLADLVDAHACGQAVQDVLGQQRSAFEELVELGAVSDGQGQVDELVGDAEVAQLVGGVGGEQRRGGLRFDRCGCRDRLGRLGWGFAFGGIPSLRRQGIAADGPGHGRVERGR